MGYSVISATGELTIEWWDICMSDKDIREAEQEISEKYRLWFIENGSIAADISHDKTWFEDYYLELVSILEAFGNESAYVTGWVVVVGEDGEVRKFVIEDTNVFQYGITSEPLPLD